MNIEEMQANADRLWKESQELKKPYDVKFSEWAIARQEVETMKLRKRIRQELATESTKANGSEPIPAIEAPTA